MYQNAQMLKEFVDELVRVAASTKDDLDVPRDFIEKHPWTLKYLSHFAEANDFRAIAKTPGVQVVLSPELESIQRYRKEHGMKPHVRYKVFVPVGTDIRTREQIFKFEEQEDGSYIALSG